MLRNLCLLSLLSLLILTACSTTNVPETQINPNADVRAQLSGWSNGSADLSSFFYAEQEASVVSGVVLDSGEFGFEFKDDVAEALLDPVPSCDGLVVSDSSAKTNQLSGVDVLKDGQTIALLGYASEEAVMTTGLDSVGDFYVQYIYADKAVSLEGDCPLGGVPGVFRYDLDLKAGWNTAVFTLLDKSNAVQTVELSSKDVPTGAAWFYSSK